MTGPIDPLLRCLRDVDGVIGGFVWGKSGTLLGRDLPARFDDDVLAEVGPRIGRIYEAFRGAGDELDTAVLVFAGHKLHVCEVEGAFVAVVSKSEVNEAALKMALHVLGRAVSAELDRRAPSAPAPAARGPGPGPVQTAGTPRCPAEPTHVLRQRLQRGKRPAG